jgi:hypothetical protein
MPAKISALFENENERDNARHVAFDSVLFEFHSDNSVFLRLVRKALQTFSLAFGFEVEEK